MTATTTKTVTITLEEKEVDDLAVACRNTKAHHGYFREECRPGGMLRDDARTPKADSLRPREAERGGGEANSDGAE